MVDVDRIKDVFLFGELTFKERQAIAKKIIMRAYEKNEIIFTAGEACQNIVIVLSGRIKIFRSSPLGQEQILETLGSGDTCACNPGVKNWPCSSSAQAMTFSEVGFLGRNDYVELVQNNSGLARSLNKIFARRLCRFSALIEEVSLDEPQKRLIKFILNMTEPAEGHAQTNPCPCVISFTHEEIAQRLGLVRETVTRHLNKLKKKKFIDLKSRQIIVPDRNLLQKHLLYPNATGLRN